MRALKDSLVSGRTEVVETPLGGVECARLGEGPPVLLLHGAMGGYDQGILLGRTVVGLPGYEFIAVSRPGYLGTPLSLGRAPERQADVCAALLDALGVRRTAVIAISGGGQTALQIALRHPDLCAALLMISACSAPVPGRLPVRYYLMKFVAHLPVLLNVLRRKAAENPEKAALRSIPDPDLRARTLADPEAGPLLLALQDSVLENLSARMAGTENDVAQARSQFHYPLERITAPTLVIHGTEDEAAPYWQSEALAARMPGAELITIQGGRHVSIFTHRNIIQPRVRQFLELHLGQGST